MVKELEEIECIRQTAKVAVAVGNFGLYLGPWGVRVEDTVLVGMDGPEILTDYPLRLEK